MHPFLEQFAIVGGAIAAIVAGIVVLAVFFSLLSRLGSGAQPEAISIRGVLPAGALADVQMASGKNFEQVRFVGFTSSESIKSNLPYELNGMVILENGQGERILVRAKDIRTIVVPAEANAASGAVAM
jgi:hypothetical protein